MDRVAHVGLRLVPQAVVFGVGAGRDRQRLQRLRLKAGRALCGHHPEQVPLDRRLVDQPQPGGAMSRRPQLHRPRIDQRAPVHADREALVRRRALQAKPHGLRSGPPVWRVRRAGRAGGEQVDLPFGLDHHPAGRADPEAPRSRAGTLAHQPVISQIDQAPSSLHRHG